MPSRLVLLQLALVVLPAGEAQSEALRWGGQEAVRIYDGNLEAVVVPAWGRLMRFGRAGGPNLLFENPNADARSSGWWNPGGDRVWIWPQEDWKHLAGRAWPPPAGSDGPCTATIEGTGRVRLFGTIPSHGLRFERIFTIAAGRLACTSRIERYGPAGQEHPVAVWQIAHIATHPRIEAVTDELPNACAAWPVVASGDALLVLRPDHAVGGGLLLRAAALRWLDADGHGLELRRMGLGGMAKLWASGKPQAAGDAHSIELELTSPEVVLPIGGSIELLTELRPLLAAP